MRTNRYSGLLKLKELGLPIPNVVKVDAINDINIFKLPETEFGWTIRTCKYNGINEIGLFYKNYIPKDELKNVLNLAFKLKKTDEFYIIYPSWEFIFSCNIVIDSNQIILEGKYGSQKTISKGKDTGDFRIIFDKNNRKKMLVGNVKPIIMGAIQRILNLLEIINNVNSYLEVCLTTKNKLIFYEFWNL